MNLYELFQTPARSLWDSIQASLPTITASCVITIMVLMFRLRDGFRDLSKEVHDKNGLRASRDDHQSRIQELEMWKVREDAIGATEREMMKDIGRDPERLRDRLTTSVEVQEPVMYKPMNPEGEKERDPNYRYRNPDKEKK